jgi:hypothetical protein
VVEAWKVEAARDVVTVRAVVETVDAWRDGTVSWAVTWRVLPCAVWKATTGTERDEAVREDVEGGGGSCEGRGLEGRDGQGSPWRGFGGSWWSR